MQREEDAMATTVNHLDVLCEVNRRLATFTDLDELLHFAARRARELFDAEGCALSLLDRGQRKLYLSADDGDPGRPSLARLEARTGVTIRVPVRNRARAIGVIDVVDPRRGHFTSDDRELLEALASDIAVAYEQAEFHDHVGRQAADLRTLELTASLGLVALGLSLVAGATLAHQAWALPLSELPMRPGMWAGLASTIVGALLVRVCRRSGRAADEPAASRHEEPDPVGSTVIRGDRAA